MEKGRGRQLPELFNLWSAPFFVNSFIKGFRIGGHGFFQSIRKTLFGWSKNDIETQRDDSRGGITWIKDEYLGLGTDAELSMQKLAKQQFIAKALVGTAGAFATGMVNPIAGGVLLLHTGLVYRSEMSNLSQSFRRVSE